MRWILALLAIAAFNVWSALYSYNRDNNLDVFDVLGLMLAGALIAIAVMGFIEERKNHNA